MRAKLVFHSTLPVMLNKYNLDKSSAPSGFRQNVSRTYECITYVRIYHVRTYVYVRTYHSLNSTTAKSGGTPLLRNLLTVAGRGKAVEAREDCQMVDNRLARKTFVRSTNFLWLAYCWWNNEMLHNTDFTDALVNINQVLRYARVIIDFLISLITADVTVLQHYVKTYRAGVIVSFCQWTHVVRNVLPF